MLNSLCYFSDFLVILSTQAHGLQSTLGSKVPCWDLINKDHQFFFSFFFFISHPWEGRDMNHVSWYLIHFIVWVCFLKGLRFRCFLSLFLCLSCLWELTILKSVKFALVIFGHTCLSRFAAPFSLITDVLLCFVRDYFRNCVGWVWEASCMFLVITLECWELFLVRVPYYSFLCWLCKWLE